MEFVFRNKFRVWEYYKIGIRQIYIHTKCDGANAH